MLTDIGLKALKGREKPYKRSDGGGLFILVNPDGKKFWRLAYRFNGKQKALSHGRYPEIGLRAARDFREAIKFQLRRGLDPAVSRMEEAQFVKAAVSHPFEEIAREWIKTRKLAWSPRYASLVVGRLEADIFPEIGDKAVNAITPSDILVALRRVEARGAVEMAHRIKNHVSEVFRYAIPDGRCESDPCRDLSPALAKPKPVEHQAKVSARELPDFFVKLRADEGERLCHLALRWTLMTMVSSQETRFAEWS
ncbi:MAG: integrase, partial [Sphingomonas bacterium]|nr:integrase [Sphingomonas bacterium]